MTDISREAALEAALKDTLDFFERHSNRYDEVNGKHPQVIVEEARAAIAMPVDAAEGRVTVKPLVWAQCQSTLPRVVFEAKSCFGRYVAWPNGKWKLYGAYGYDQDGDLDTAKSAAQADYDARILSAITPAPSDKIAEAAELIGEARLTLDCDAMSIGETVNYQPETITAVLGGLDASLRALAGKGE